MNKRAIRQSKGFTLIELTVVVFLLTMITMIGIPSFRGLYVRSEMQGVTSEFVNTMRYAQQRAILERVPVQLVIDVEERAFWVPVRETIERRHYRSRSHRMQSARRTQRSSRAQQVRYEKAIPSRLPEGFIFEFVYKVNENNEVFRGEAEITFNPDGSADPVYITILRLAETEARERRLFIKTTAATGMIRSRDGVTQQEGSEFFRGDVFDMTDRIF